MRPSDSLDTIFHDALDRAPCERSEFLLHACGGDESMRRDIESLLAADNSAADFLETPAPSRFGNACTRGESVVPAAIGPFEVTRVIATGGMGTVFEARQREPCRTVAVKLLRGSLASTSAARRFAEEAQVLSRLNHPGIAQVIAAGTHQCGALQLPYFAMEYLDDAETLIEHSNKRQLSLRQRLLLFVQVCDAVSHGHQRGIIHRDLKPGNVVVGGNGLPKVIDFGVARAVDAELTPGAPQTEAGQWVGTLAYMSPEQCGPDPRAVDIRTDVYSLGLMLYELLSNRRPYDVERVSIAEAGRIIRDDAPPRLASVASAVPADVDTIVHKAIEKTPERRYRSVADLADDIRRYLDNRPIEARPVSAAYHLRKWVSRHQAISAMAAGIVLVLAVFLIVLTVQSKRIAEERNAATAEARRAGQISDFLRGVLEMIEPANKGLDISGGELLERSVRRIDSELAGAPAVQAELRQHIGCIYSRLGKFEEAERLLRSSYDYFRHALGEDSRETANGAYSLACMLYDRGDFTAAQPLWQSAYDVKRRLYGDADPRVAYLVNPIALHIGHEGDWAHAEKMLQQAVQSLRAAHPRGSIELAITLSNLAEARQRRGDLIEAEALQRQALAIKHALLGPAHWHVAVSLRNLGVFLLDSDRPVEAEPLLRESTVLRQSYLPPGHWQVAESQNELGRCLLQLGRIDEARPHLVESHSILLRAFGPDDPRTRRALANVSTPDP